MFFSVCPKISFWFRQTWYNFHKTPSSDDSTRSLFIYLFIYHLFAFICLFLFKYLFFKWWDKIWHLSITEPMCYLQHHFMIYEVPGSISNCVDHSKINFKPCQHHNRNSLSSQAQKEFLTMEKQLSPWPWHSG